MERENKTFRKREKCGDCFYNGKCFIPVTKCQYIKNEIIEKRLKN